MLKKHKSANNANEIYGKLKISSVTINPKNNKELKFSGLYIYHKYNNK